MVCPFKSGVLVAAMVPAAELRERANSRLATILKNPCVDVKRK